MRKPSEYVSAALAKLRDRLIPDCSEVLRHGERTATVTRIGSPSIGASPLTGEDVAESVRVLASAIDFPELSKGSLVSLSDKWRIVTSAQTDPARASLLIGMSASLDEVLVVYRRPNTQIRQSISALVAEKDILDAWSDNFAPVSSRGWLVAFSQSEWMENTEPHIGDDLTIDDRTMRCADVAKRDGYFLLTCRARR